MEGDSMSEDLTKKLPTGDDNVAIILQNIDSRLERLEQKVEERLHDTRPIWEKVVADIAQLQEGQRQLQEGQSRLEADVHDTKISMREIKWQIGEIAESYVQVKGRARELEGRVRDLEQQNKPTNSST
jgi:archaellum component FlaC